MLKVFRLLPLIFLLNCCQRSPLKVDVSGIDLKLNIKRLDQDIFTVTPDSLQNAIPKLAQKYGSFFKAYNENVIALGDPTDPMYSSYFNTFITDSIRIASHAKIDSAFSNLAIIQQKLGKRVQAL